MNQGSSLLLRNREANQRLYERDPKIFDKAHLALLKTQENYLDTRVRELWTYTQGTRFLDMGCGTGWLLRLGQRYFPYVIGIDLSRSLAKSAKGRVVCGDATFLPFRGQVFDVIACSFTLHHVYDRTSMLSEVSRILVPGGFFYIDNEANSAFFRRFRFLVRLHDLLNGLDKRYKALYGDMDVQTIHLAEYYGYQKGGLDPSTLQQELVEAGLEPIHLGYHWYGVNPIMNRICSIIRLRETPSQVSPQFCIIAKRVR